MPKQKPNEQVQQIPLSEIRPFKNHPFKVTDDELMQQTIDSIMQVGVLNPAIIRPAPEGGYEMVAGHRRLHAADLAGLKTIPAIVRNLDDDEAVILMVDSNLQRETISPMEKARAAPEKPSGKQTVRQLIGQNQGVSNIEITNSNIKGFERIARKYGVDFAVKKDRSVSPPKYFVFFKARDADALTAAFKEYTAYELKRAAKAQNRPSVLAHLQALKAKVQAITPGKSRNQNRGITI